MCGIFGYVGTRLEASQLVLAGLKKLEYRGYDSWGIASREEDLAPARLVVEKHVGKIGRATTSLPGSSGALGHTRWATHGGVTDANAHPHLDCQGRLAVIHNGIIENHTELKHALLARGHTFTSQTDTEVVAHMLEDELARREARGSGGDALSSREPAQQHDRDDASGKDSVRGEPSADHRGKATFRQADTAEPGGSADTAEVRSMDTTAEPGGSAETAEVRSMDTTAEPGGSAETAESRSMDTPAEPGGSADTAEVRSMDTTAEPGGSAETAEVRSMDTTAEPGGSADTAEVRSMDTTAQPGGSAETAEVRSMDTTAEPGGSAETAESRSMDTTAEPGGSAETAEVRSMDTPAEPGGSADTAEVRSMDTAAHGVDTANRRCVAGSEPRGQRLVDALMTVFRRLDGLSALGVIDRQEHCIAAAKNGSPLVLGWGADGNYLASDSSALIEHTRQLTFLEDGQAALIGPDSVAVYDVASGLREADPRIWNITWKEEAEGLEGYADYMAKEIREQPLVLRRLADQAGAEAQRLADEIKHASTVHLVGCGSAAHAARCGEYLFSRVASRQANCVVGSEFGYLADFLDPRSLVVGLSQSGETIDLLESMKAALRRGARLAALVNVEGSSLYRLVDHPILLSAGPERCVLATKSFTAKLGVLLMAAYAAVGRLEAGRQLVEQAADEIQSFLTDGRVEQVRALAERIAACQHLYVIGRGPSYPMALEAALKIKEVSYMHAEGFAGGELKHGVIALVEAGSPCLVLAPNDETFHSILSGAEEIKARGGYIIGISPFASDVWDEHIRVADVGEAASIVNAVPPQVLAYELAIRRGLDPDKPRNLAKSVTVK